VEKALEESEEKYRLLIDNAAEKRSSSGKTTLSSFSNAATLGLMEGYSPQELSSRPSAEFIHPG